MSWGQVHIGCGFLKIVDTEHSMVHVGVHRDSLGQASGQLAFALRVDWGMKQHCNQDYDQCVHGFIC
jgi:hypothetical protein